MKRIFKLEISRSDHKMNQSFIHHQLMYIFYFAENWFYADMFCRVGKEYVQTELFANSSYPCGTGSGVMHVKRRAVLCRRRHCVICRRRHTVLCRRRQCIVRRRRHCVVRRRRHCVLCCRRHCVMGCQKRQCLFFAILGIAERALHCWASTKCFFPILVPGLPGMS